MSDVPDFRLEHSELRGDDEFAEFTTNDLPYYSDWRGSFEKLPWATDDESLRAAECRRRDRRRAARRRCLLASRSAVRPPRDPHGADHVEQRLRLVDPARRGAVLEPHVVDAGDAPIVPTRLERGLRVIHEKVFRVAEAGPIPIVLGGDHSITYPSAAAVARHMWPRRVGVVHFDAHADTGADQWGNLYGHGEPMRRLIEEGWIAGPNFVQVGLRGYWPEQETFDWMREQGFRWHTMVEIEERGGEAVIADAIAEALDGPDCIYLSRRHRRRRPRHGAGHRHARVGRHARARAAARGAPDRRAGRPGRHGRRRGLAAVRPRRGHRDPRASHRDGSDQRPRAGRARNAS